MGDRPKARAKCCGVEIQVERLEPRAALRTYVRACRVFGEGGLKLLCRPPTDTIEVPDAAKRAKGNAQATRTVTLATDSVLPGLFAEADPDEVMGLAEALLCGSCSVLDGEDWEDVIAGGAAQLDILFPSFWSLAEALRFALAHNFAPTSPVESTSGVSPRSTTGVK